MNELVLLLTLMMTQSESAPMILPAQANSPAAVQNCDSWQKKFPEIKFVNIHGEGKNYCVNTVYLERVTGFMSVYRHTRTYPTTACRMGVNCNPNLCLNDTYKVLATYEKSQVNYGFCWPEQVASAKAANPLR